MFAFVTLILTWVLGSVLVILTWCLMCGVLCGGLLWASVTEDLPQPKSNEESIKQTLVQLELVERAASASGQLPTDPNIMKEIANQ